MSDDNPGIVQQHLINMARRHEHAPAQSSAKVTITRTGNFNGTFSTSHWLSQAWSPDGTQLAYGGSRSGSGEGILQVWDGNTGHHESHRMRHLTHDVTGAVVSLAWAPDSGRLATIEVNHSSGERAVGIRSQAGSRTLAVPHGLPVSQVTWSPDGTLLALSGPDCTQTVLFDPEAGTVRRTLDNLCGPVAWRPDGRLIAGIYETSVLLCDPATGGRTGRLAGHDQRPTVLAWARHGTFLAVADGERIRVWDADAATQASLIPWTTSEGDRGPDGTIASIEWLDGGRYLVEFRPRGGAWRDERGTTCSTAILWDALEAKWYFLELFYGLVNGVHRPLAGAALAPDGRRYAHAIDFHAPIIWRINGDLPGFTP